MDDKIQKAFRLMFSANKGERENAAETVISLCKKEGVSPSELTLVHTRELHGQLYEQRRRLQAEVEAGGEALAFIKGRAADNVTLSEAMGWLQHRQAKVDRWPQLRELARRHLFRGGWPEERSVFKMIASAVGVGPEEVRAVLQRIQSATPGRNRRPERKRVAAKQVLFAGVQLPEKEYVVVQCLLGAGPGGLHHRKIAEQTGIKAKTVTSRLSYLKKFDFAEQTGKLGFWRASERAVQGAAASGREALQVA
jgi:hypothetical protein